MKKTVSIVLLLTLLAGILSGCGTSLKGDDKGAIISAYMLKYPVTLDPAVQQSDAEAIGLFGLVYEGLTTVDAKGEVKEGLATSWRGYQDRITEEYKMEFKLRDSRWSDQREISADDIIFAWKRILDPEFESPYAALLYPIKNAKKCKSGEMTSDDLGLVADNDKTLTVTFEKDYDINLFAEIVASPGLVALPEDTVRRNDDTWFNTPVDMAFNGPFKIVSMEKGYKLILERNTYYKREKDEDEKEYLEKYVLPYRIVCYYGEYDKTKVLSISEITDRFNSGEVKFISSFTKDTYSSVSTSSVDTLTAFTYYFNTKNTVLSNAKVRQALSVSLDRQKIASEIVSRGVVPATGFVPTGVFNTGKGTDFRSAGGDLYSTSADTEKAKSLLKEAGVSSGSFTITYVDIDGDDTQKKIAEYAASVWKGLGFNVNTQSIKQTFFDKTVSTNPKWLEKAGYDVIGVDCSAISTDAFAYLAPFARMYSGSYIALDSESDYTPHFTGFENDAYDKLADEVVYVSDRNERTEKLHAMEKALADECPATALYFNKKSYAASGSLSGYTTEYFGTFVFDELKLKDYQSVNEDISAKIKEGEEKAALAAAEKAN